MKNYIFIFTLTLTLIGCIGIPEIKESQIRDLKKDSLKTNSVSVNLKFIETTPIL